MNQRDISSDPIASLIAPEFSTSPWHHFSIDDVFDSLIDVTNKEMPLFEHPFFALMKEMHDLYDTQVDLELFFEREIDGTHYTLCNVRDLTTEIQEAGSWLKFGPHAQSYLVAPFEQTPEQQVVVFEKIYAEIARFAGKDTFAKWTRLHYYSESYELAMYFKDRGVTALFTTDREEGSHRMPQTIADSLLTSGFASYEQANFIRTQYRVEVFTNHRDSEENLKAMFLDSIAKYGYVIFYSHEYEFARSEVRSMTRRAFKVLSELGVTSIKL